MKQVGRIKNQISEECHYLNLKDASPEAVESILQALNAEVNEAIAEQRFPSIEKAFGRLSCITPSLQ